MDTPLPFPRCALVLCLSAWMTLPVLGQDTDKDPAPKPSSERGITRTEKATVGAKYRKHWALVIGVNYDGKRPDSDRLAVPELKNAANDAKAFHELLIKHYGFQGEQGEAILLLEEQATHANIRRYLAEDFLSDPKRVKEEDCVLVFFAGHGLVMPDGGASKDRGVILPHDVKTVNGKPTANTVVWMQNDLVGLLNNSPARHKLLILDCCHSGEIYNRDDLPAAIKPEEFDHRDGSHLFKIPGFLAMASCRERQPAQDGRDNNSPFTKVLLQAMRTIPLQEGPQSAAFTTFQLFKAMRPELKLPGGQDPACRCLKGDGEFRFFPAGDFAPYANRSIEIKLLQAMNPGEHGNWWFDETPWMLPSVRRMILEEQDISRNLIPTQFIQMTTLQRCAERALNKLRASEDPIRQMRAEHLALLLRPKRGKNFTTTIDKIRVEMEDVEGKLEPTDLHFLAVVRHYVADPKARTTYEKALDGYSKASQEGAAKLDYKPLEALCRSDYGHFLTEVEADHGKAMEEFEQARTLFGLNAPVPFSMFILCRQADCFQRMDRWAQANERLAMAGELVDRLEKNHPLTSFYFRRRAWARMEQWRVLEAAKDFEESNKRLEDNTNSNAIIGKLHNRHGLAMALRFQGESDEATMTYRQILQDVAKHMLDLRDGKLTPDDVADVRARLLERWVNSNERLVDCNLFTTSQNRDLKEASEDLRRAIRATASLRPEVRIREKVRMLYKLAIILSLPEPGSQDMELAEAYCKQAGELMVKLGENAPKDLEYYHLLAPRIVGLYKAMGDSVEAVKLKRLALAELREKIGLLAETLRDNLQRDRVEFLMFTAKVLVEESIPSDRFNTLEDTEILMSLCRKTMLARSDSFLSYLRQYFDAVMTARLAMHPKHVKGLLEVQKAATTGQFFIKQAEPSPILALYVLGDQTHLLFDVPRGLSKCYVLPDDYTPERLQEAMQNPDKRLVLPREVVKTLQDVANRPGPSGAPVELKIHCWLDGKVGVGERVGGTSRISLYPRTNLAFPFQLPRNVLVADLAIPGMPAVAREK